MLGYFSPGLALELLTISSCAWNDPENNDPPVVFYEGDQGIGKYSVRHVPFSRDYNNT